MSLRLRATVAFGVVALLLAGLLSVFTYLLVRNWIVTDRQNATVGQAYTSARLIRSRLASGETDYAALLSGLQVSSSGEALLERNGQWFSSTVGVGESELPSSLKKAVVADHAAHQTVDTRSGPVLAVGVPLAESSASFFVLEPLNDIEHTLNVLATVLWIGSAVAAVVGAVTGALVSRRILRPLSTVSRVAEEIATGNTDARLPSRMSDPDLRPLVTSFNEMVDQLAERARREARFASDVSHDLRGPLAAFAAAVSVVQRRRASLPPEALTAVDILDEEVQSFSRLVSDLLEISRFEAGTVTLQTEPVDAVAFVEGLLADTDRPIPVVRPPGYAARISVDARRMNQVFANLLDNAARYGGGATRLLIGPGAEAGWVAITVEDHGPGVPPELRHEIFSRYARGRAEHDPTMPKGTGLGLALAEQHVKLHGGSIRVEDTPGGGARFVIELPEVVDAPAAIESGGPR